MQLFKKLYLKISCLYKKIFSKNKEELVEEVKSNSKLSEEPKKGGISVISCRVNNIKKKQ